MPISRSQRVALLPRDGRNPNIILRNLCTGGREFRLDLGVKVGCLFVRQEDDTTAIKCLHLFQGFGRLVGFASSIKEFTQHDERQIDVIYLIDLLVKCEVCRRYSITTLVSSRTLPIAFVDIFAAFVDVTL